MKIAIINTRISTNNNTRTLPSRNAFHSFRKYSITIDNLITCVIVYSYQFSELSLIILPAIVKALQRNPRHVKNWYRSEWFLLNSRETGKFRVKLELQSRRWTGNIGRKRYPPLPCSFPRNCLNTSNFAPDVQ